LRNCLSSIAQVAVPKNDDLGADALAKQLQLGSSCVALLRTTLRNALYQMVGPGQPNPQSLNFSDAFTTALVDIQHWLSERNVERSAFVLDASGDTGRLYVDPEHLHQLLVNVLTNAVVYSSLNDDNKCHVVLSVRTERSVARISVKDWGVGIAEGFEAAIFEDGFRGAASPETNPGGLGIGLSVSRQLAEVNGGWLKITRRRNPTEFTLCLPLAQSRSLSRHRGVSMTNATGRRGFPK